MKLYQHKLQCGCFGARTISKGKGENTMKNIRSRFELPITIKLTGVSFGETQENIKRFGCRDIGTYALIREPDNPHDPNAIQVAIAYWVMGYLPKATARFLAPLMDAGRTFLAEFVCRNEHPKHRLVGLTVRIVETGLGVEKIISNQITAL
jgi:hypothetical protein